MLPWTSSSSVRPLCTAPCSIAASLPSLATSLATSQAFNTSIKIFARRSLRCTWRNARRSTCSCSRRCTTLPSKLRRKRRKSRRSPRCVGTATEASSTCCSAVLWTSVSSHRDPARDQRRRVCLGCDPAPNLTSVPSAVNSFCASHPSSSCAQVLPAWPPTLALSCPALSGLSLHSHGSSVPKSDALAAARAASPCARAAQALRPATTAPVTDSGSKPPPPADKRLVPRRAPPAGPTVLLQLASPPRVTTGRSHSSGEVGSEAGSLSCASSKRCCSARSASRMCWRARHIETSTANCATSSSRCDWERPPPSLSLRPLPDCGGEDGMDKA
mmetsp:Transcript_60316/g.155388  ORF Transcript_60316/g.155388 Transcript_60316/m.155388 type:complete len:330 (-) Transcript_60316:899-1888(-)